MFWGYISGESLGYGTFITQGTIKSHVYTHILQTSLLDTLEYYHRSCEDVRFQQDRAFAQTSVLATKIKLRENGLSNEVALDCPAHSSDLNPIEHHLCYQLMKQKFIAHSTHLLNTVESEVRIITQYYTIAQQGCFT